MINCKYQKVHIHFTCCPFFIFGRLDQFSIDFYRLSQCQFANSNDHLEYFKKDCGIDFYRFILSQLSFVKKFPLNADEVLTYLVFFLFHLLRLLWTPIAFFLYCVGNFWYYLVHFNTHSSFLFFSRVKVHKFGPTCQVHLV